VSAGRRQGAVDALLTVIVPVFNEKGTIDQLLRSVMVATIPSYDIGAQEADRGTAWKQVVVVDDGSTDGTAEKLKAWERQLIVVSHGANRGKGAAIRTGLRFATGTYTVIQDADLEYDPRDYTRLLEPLLAGEADAVYGSRYLTRTNVRGPRTKVVSVGAGSGDPRTTVEKESGDRSPHSNARWSMCRWGVGLLNLAVRWLYGVRLSDEATCYKVFRTDDLRAMDLKCEGFEFCPEVTAKACRMGLSIREVPISYNARTVAEGKKIRWRDGLSALATLWRWRKWQPPTVSTE
jgi:glycosyltransferase involved in cell wall biosynthesis